MAKPAGVPGILRRFLRENSAQFAIMTAIMTPVAISLAAFAVDAGSLYLEKREAQGLADLAAITAAANLDKAEKAALATLADNGVGDVVLGGLQPNGKPEFRDGKAGPEIVILPGQYRASSQTGHRDRFVANAEPRNAVKIIYKTVGTRHFAGALIPPPRIVVEAVAESSSAAAFSVGSRLLALKEEGLVNALLGGLTGSRITLTVMDYRALLDADVQLLSFLDALALEAGITAGTYQQVLDAEVTLGQIARALSNTRTLGGNAKTAANRLAQQTGGQNQPRLRLSRLIDLGQTGGQLMQAGIERIGLDVGVLQLVTASAVVAGKGKQVALDLGVHIPGLLGASVSLAIGEPPQHSPWLRIGAGGELVRTAQTRLSVVAEIGGLLGVSIRVPLYLELAHAEARLKSVTCPDGRPDSVRVAIEARPGVANLYLAEVSPAKIAGFANPVPRSPARLLQVPLLVTVTAEAQAEISNTTYKPLTFTWSDIAGDRVRQVSTNELTGSLTKSLLSSLDLKVEALGGLLGIGIPSNLRGTVATLVSAATPALDTLLDELLTMLGLALGEADIRVHGATCGRAVLVQ